MEQHLQATLQRQSENLRALLSELSTKIRGDAEFPSDSLWQSKVATVHSALNKWNFELDSTHEFVYDMPRSHHRDKLEVALEGSRRLKSINEATFREIVAQYRANRIKQEKLARQDLFTPSSLADQMQQKRSGAAPDESAMMAATDTTTSLQRMRQIMAVELEKSVANMVTLDSQTQTLKKTGSEYSRMGELLMQARRRISMLESRDRTDRILMLLACLVFASVVLYIINKRVVTLFF